MGNVVQNNKFEQGFDHWYWFFLAPLLNTSSGDGKKYARLQPSCFIGQQLYGLVKGRPCRIRFTAKREGNTTIPIRVDIDSKTVYSLPDSNDIIEIWTNFNMSTDDPVLIIFNNGPYDLDITDISVTLF